MKNRLLKLSDIDFNYPKINIEEIREFQREDSFTVLAVELFKVNRMIVGIMGCMYRLTNNNEPRTLTRNEAILSGLMIRITKLQAGILDNVCQNKSEIAEILFRCLFETLINVSYFLEKNTDDSYYNYIKYSLKTENELFSYIETEIKNRGEELPFETRMKRSILKAFHDSGFCLKEVNEGDSKGWSRSIFERAKDAGLLLLYKHGFRLLNHSVHGNWQDLIQHHIKRTQDGYVVNPEWTHFRPHRLFLSIIICADVSKKFLYNVLKPCDDYNKIEGLLDRLIKDSNEIYRQHEIFIQSN